MTDQPSPKYLLIEMFQQMVVKKNSNLTRQYFHPDFLLETNGERQDFASFLEGHRRVYVTDITYEASYDDNASVESTDRVAARVWIKTQNSEAAPPVFEVVLIAIVHEQKFYRMWETTWPDWRSVKGFETYQSPVC
jgi:hypothetical protein